MSTNTMAKLHQGRRGWIMASIMAVLAVVVIGGWQFEVRQAAIAKAKEWAPVGAPCPTISAADYLTSGFSASNHSSFDGVGFARAYGYIVCDDIADDGGKSSTHIPVCQFNDPGALDISTGQGHVYYLPRTQPATVIVSHGRPSCVLATSQRLDPPGG